MEDALLEKWLAHAAEEVNGAELRRVDELHVAVALYMNRGPLRDRDRSLTVTPFGRSFALRDLARPAEGRSNRVIAFEPSDVGLVDDLIRFYEDAAIPCQLDVLPGRWTAAVREVLRTRGFELRGMACTSAGVPSSRSSGDPRAWPGVTIEPVTVDTLAVAIAIGAAVLGQASPQRATVELRRAEFALHADYQLALARVDGEPAAIGAWFIRGRDAYVAGAMTLPAMRRRGCQAALLAHRLGEAARRGCERVVTDTLGDNESQRNVERAGLRPVCWPGWWVRPLAGAPERSETRL